MTIGLARDQLVSFDELQAMLRRARGSQFVTFVARVDARLKKTNNPFAGPVRKISRVNGVIGWDYARSVNAQRKREGADGDFEPAARTWGTRLAAPSEDGPHGLRGLSPLIEHNGKLYLEVKVERVFETRYEDADGVELTPEQVKPFLPGRASAAAH